MLAPKHFLIGFGVLLLALAAGLFHSMRATRHLRESVASAPDHQRILLELQHHWDELPAQLPSNAEPARAEEEALQQAKRDLANLLVDYQRVALAAMRHASGVPELAELPPGRMTPDDAMQSVIHAIASGEADLLGGLIEFDTSARIEADAFLAELPPDLQEQFTDSTQLVAQVMAAKTNLNLSTATTERLEFASPDDATLRLRLNHAVMPSRTATFRLHRDSGGWRLRVPVEVIEGYRAYVTGLIP